MSPRSLSVQLASASARATQQVATKHDPINQAAVGVGIIMPDAKYNIKQPGRSVLLDLTSDKAHWPGCNAKLLTKFSAENAPALLSACGLPVNDTSSPPLTLQNTRSVSEVVYLDQFPLPRDLSTAK